MWRNNQEDKKGLFITEDEPFSIAQYPAIASSITNEKDYKTDLNQFGRKLVKDGKVIGKVLQGAFTFDIVIRCACETSAQRKLLSDATMAVLLINRERFIKDYGIVVDTYRRGGYGSTPHLQNDRDIYWQDITLSCYGEWTFDLVDDTLQKLGGFNQCLSLGNRKVASNLSMLWNLENF